MVIEESGMQFEFPDNRTTVKFDEELFYKNCFNETDINPPAELGRLADASGDKRSARRKTPVV